MGTIVLTSEIKKLKNIQEKNAKTVALNDMKKELNIEAVELLIDNKLIL